MSSPAAPLLAHLWQKNRPTILERLDLLDRAAAEPGNVVLQQEALDIAHKLSGSLGMFGFPLGTQIARALEEGLETGQIRAYEQSRLTRALRECLFPTES